MERTYIEIQYVNANNLALYNINVVLRDTLISLQTCLFMLMTLIRIEMYPNTLLVQADYQPLLLACMLIPQYKSPPPQEHDCT